MLSETQLAELAQQIKIWGQELGFQQIGITDTDAGIHTKHFNNWCDKKLHGTMEYMVSHGEKRTQPHLLVPGTQRIISARMNYLPITTTLDDVTANNNNAYIARYSLGRDYHKVVRKRLTTLSKKINSYITSLHNSNIDFSYRTFVDSAPILEKAFAEKAGLGWIGKNTLLLNRDAGSWFFIGEILTNIPLPTEEKKPINHCGSCTACLDICPTKAFIGPYQLDARKCIAYLTIEYKGSIDETLRPLIGNRIFGCDDCQIVCPWNKFAQLTQESDFSPRQQLTDKKLLELFSWSEEIYLQLTEGSALRRIGYSGWLRNIAIALGNTNYSPTIVTALNEKLKNCDALVGEHVAWALNQQLAHKPI